MNPYTKPSKIEGFRRLVPTKQWGFFSREIQSGAFSDTNMTITGDSKDVLLSLVSRISDGSIEWKMVANKMA